MYWFVLLAQIALFLASAVILMVVLGLVYQSLGERKDARRFPAPGKRVDVDGQLLHYQESGKGDPVVVLESGISASSLNWERVVPLLANRTRVIRYDRGGLGWSGPAGEARIASRLVLELRGVLESANAMRPVILVGHSFGGLLCLLYACRYRDQVAGIVLVDPVPRVEWYPISGLQLHRLNHGIRLALRGALLARLGIVRLALNLMMGGARRFPKAIASASSGRASSVIERLIGEVRKMPEHLWPIIQAHWSTPRTFLSMASHFENLPDSIAEYLAETYPPHVPLTVLSAESSPIEAMDEHVADSQLSLVGTHRVVPNSGHWIQLDQPEVVAGAVLELVEFLQSLEQPASR